MAPLATPISTPTNSATKTGYGPPGTVACGELVAKLAETMPASAKTEPTERSMPPVMMTKVIPKARTPLIDVCSRIFDILLCVRKYLLAKDSAMTRMTKAR